MYVLCVVKWARGGSGVAKIAPEPKSDDCRHQNVTALSFFHKCTLSGSLTLLSLGSFILQRPLYRHISFRTYTTHHHPHQATGNKDKPHKARDKKHQTYARKHTVLQPCQTTSSSSHWLHPTPSTTTNPSQPPPPQGNQTHTRPNTTHSPHKSSG